MSNSTVVHTRRSRITASLIAVIMVLLVALAFSIYQNIHSMNTASAPKPTRVERGATYIADAGFVHPVYLGVRQYAEGNFPTYRAIAVGGQPVNLLIRTTTTGWEIQPDGTNDTVNSAEKFAGLAQSAVEDWKFTQATMKPSPKGVVGAYEFSEARYELLAKYNPPASYWLQRYDTVATGWPSK